MDALTVSTHLLRLHPESDDPPTFGHQDPYSAYGRTLGRFELHCEHHEPAKAFAGGSHRKKQR